MSIISTLECNGCGSKMPVDRLSRDVRSWVIVQCLGAVDQQIRGTPIHLCIEKCIPALSRQFPALGIQFLISHDTKVPIKTAEIVKPETRLARATVRPQYDWFQIASLAIDGNPADWAILDFKIGNRSQFAQAGMVPGDSFSAMQSGELGNVDFDICPSSCDITIEVRYIGPNKDGERFVADLIGRASGEGTNVRSSGSAVPEETLDTQHSHIHKGQALFESLAEKVRPIAVGIRAFLESDAKSERAPSDRIVSTVWHAIWHDYQVKLEYIPANEKWETIASGAAFTGCENMNELAYNVTKIATAHAAKIARRTPDPTGRLPTVAVEMSNGRPALSDVAPSPVAHPDQPLYPARYVLRIFKEGTSMQHVHKFQVEEAQATRPGGR